MQQDIRTTHLIQVMPNHVAEQETQHRRRNRSRSQKTARDQPGQDGIINQSKQLESEPRRPPQQWPRTFTNGHKSRQVSTIVIKYIMIQHSAKALRGLTTRQPS